MQFLKALSLSLGELEEPVITRYRLGLIVHRLYQSKSYSGEKIRIQKEQAGQPELSKSLGGLQENGILKEHPEFHGTVYQLLGRKAESVEEVVCSVDPFCYISHLSAMAYHGLTDRLPTRLFISTPPPAVWSEEARKRMKRDLGDGLEEYLAAGLPQLQRLKMNKIGRTEIHRFTSVEWRAYTNVRGRVTRVSSIGRTFLDMLRNPELCGGMHHVVEVFQQAAGQYLQPIVEEIDNHGAPIIKVRAGYILEELMGLENTKVAGWVAYAQRGGSRKLDPAGDYLPQWSEKWCLSLNL